MRYDGGKGTCFAQLINLMPPHEVYVETHLGGGAVMRHKKPALRQIGIERDAKVIAATKDAFNGICEVVHGDAVEWLQAESLSPDTLVYADPPYHPDTRRRARVYRHDYAVQDHENLLAVLKGLPCKVLISGYDNPLYADQLADWERHQFQMRTRTGMRTETVWFNFKRPEIPHDYRHLGDNFREREVIRRRQGRLRERLGKLSLAEKAALHAWLSDEIKGATQL
ncbi:DNA adenine methylase [Pseudomonas sp. AU12215]|uniref:DNA adenine methylase n=1 Tax=Pseudomonas sp. AU12215 TaxID=1860123 RepID=UPI000806D022|nr:DNA adenine methylase [Pseudomonas sp. AU12215]OBY58490.1 DNA methylase [Pseudomonas sp. AU12215]